MYILNNIYDRNYKKEYPDFDNVIFDISEKQLNNAKNKDWKDISKGNIVCVVKSSRKISTFFLVESIKATGIISSENGEAHVITGRVIAKLKKEEGMSSLLNKHNVVHPYLPKNKFGIGLNVANIGNSLDSLSVHVSGGISNLGEVVANYA